MGSDRAAPDASSELVQLRQPQTFRVLDNHQAGIRYVDPDLNDRGGDQRVQFALLEGLHNRLFICRFHPAMHEADIQLRQQEQSSSHVASAACASSDRTLRSGVQTQ